MQWPVWNLVRPCQIILPNFTKISKLLNDCSKISSSLCLGGLYLFFLVFLARKWNSCVSFFPSLAWFLSRRETSLITAKSLMNKIIITSRHLSFKPDQISMKIYCKLSCFLNFKALDIEVFYLAILKCNWRKNVVFGPGNFCQNIT